MQRTDSKVKFCVSTSFSVAFCSPGKHCQCKKPLIDFDDLSKNLLPCIILDVCGVGNFLQLLVEMKAAAGFEDGRDFTL
jgi:hypothetical protein